MRTLENFKKENNLTNEQMGKLQYCYESPFNQYQHLSFVDYLYELKAAENGAILKEMLAM